MLEKHVDAASCSIIPFSNKLFWIDQLGQIRYDATRELVQSKIDHNQEAWAWIFSYNGWAWYKVAILLQLTFKPVHVPRVLLNKLDIIYRDNDKTNLCPSNIIWKFPKDGLRHPDFPEFAITETKYGKKIIVRNIFTNKTAVFNSIALAASFANVCNEKVADFIDRKPNCIPTNGFDYKLDGSLEPFKEWSDLQKRQIKIFNGNPPSSYVVHDLLTNDKVFFHCGSDAARFFNIELDTFRFYGRPNKDRLFRNRYKFIQVLFHQLPSIEGSVKVLSVGNNGTEPLELLETPEECHATA